MHMWASRLCSPIHYKQNHMHAEYMWLLIALLHSPTFADVNRRGCLLQEILNWWPLNKSWIMHPDFATQYQALTGPLFPLNCRIHILHRLRDLNLLLELLTCLTSDSQRTPCLACEQRRQTRCTHFENKVLSCHNFRGNLKLQFTSTNKMQLSFLPRLILLFFISDRGSDSWQNPQLYSLEFPFLYIFLYFFWLASLTGMWQGTHHKSGCITVQQKPRIKGKAFYGSMIQPQKVNLCGVPMLLDIRA